jgi:hypothetical protein
MNESNFESSDIQAPSAFLPIVLVELSLALLFTFLCLDQSAQRSRIQEAIKQREPMVQQSAQLQGKLQKLIEDFNTATPEEAKTVFAKYGIQFTPKAAVSPTPAK